MHEQDKCDANDDQLRTYFNSHDRFWRLNKIILIKKSLESREELKGVYRSFYGDNYFDFENLVYENITNGLLADGISEVVMLCEDYFGLLKLIRERHYFVKRMINYQAGKITSVAGKLKKINDEKLRLLFFIPNKEFVENNFVRSNIATANSDIKLFNERLQMLLSSHREAINFYNKYEEMHNLYKHGLKLCLNGLGNGITQEALKEKKAELSANVWKFDNCNQNLSGLVIPNISSPSISKHATTLLKERNLLHLGIMNHMHIDHLIKVACTINDLITILIGNRISLITSKENPRIEVSLPSGNTERMTCVSYQFHSSPRYSIPTINDYQVKI